MSSIDTVVPRTFAHAMRSKGKRRAADPSTTRSMSHPKAVMMPMPMMKAAMLIIGDGKRKNRDRTYRGLGPAR
jgi:hypothetical protein